MEYRRFPAGKSEVSTFEYHRDRARAPHLEQSAHKYRMYWAKRLVMESKAKTVIDLGCGDGGLMSLLCAEGVEISGYDFAPANVSGWEERGVQGFAIDFVQCWEDIPRADLYMMTEVLEHLEEPEQAVRRVAVRGSMVVASSPWNETPNSIDACHNWAWDMIGYANLFNRAGMEIVRHVQAEWSQVVLAKPEG